MKTPFCSPYLPDRLTPSIQPQTNNEEWKNLFSFSFSPFFSRWTNIRICPKSEKRRRGEGIVDNAVAVSQIKQHFRCRHSPAPPSLLELCQFWLLKSCDSYCLAVFWQILFTRSGHRMPYRKLRETKQHLSWLPDLALCGCCLVSLNDLWLNQVFGIKKGITSRMIFWFTIPHFKHRQEKLQITIPWFCGVCTSLLCPSHNKWGSNPRAFSLHGRGFPIALPNAAAAAVTILLSHSHSYRDRKEGRKVLKPDPVSPNPLGAAELITFTQPVRDSCYA